MSSSRRSSSNVKRSSSLVAAPETVKVLTFHETRLGMVDDKLKELKELLENVSKKVETINTDSEIHTKIQSIETELASIKNENVNEINKLKKIMEETKTECDKCMTNITQNISRNERQLEERFTNHENDISSKITSMMVARHNKEVDKKRVELKIQEGN